MSFTIEHIITYDFPPQVSCHLNLMTATVFLQRWWPCVQWFIRPLHLKKNTEVKCCSFFFFLRNSSNQLFDFHIPPWQKRQTSLLESWPQKSEKRMKPKQGEKNEAANRSAVLCLQVCGSIQPPALAIDCEQCVCGVQVLSLLWGPKSVYTLTL